MRNNSNLYFVLLSMMSSLSFTAHADDYFPPQLLKLVDGDDKSYSNEDLSIFNRSEIPPGNYTFDILINKKFIENKKIEMYEATNVRNEKQLLPCLAKKDLLSYGIKLPNHVIEKSDTSICMDLNQIPYFKFHVELSNNSLNITLPQSYIDEKKLKYFEKTSWDSGVPAILIGYDLSQFHSYRDEKTEDNYYGNIRSAINLGAWRYDNYSTWNKNSNRKSDWNVLTNTLSTIIKPLNSDLVLGDTYTSSSTFNSIKIKGVKLLSSQLMRSNLYNTYAPNVMGLADSDSILTITQNGNVIYKKSIPAGPFNITDYYPLGNGGNLNVDVMGIDGVQKSFIVPFSSMNFLERKGSYQYSFSTGKYNGVDKYDDNYINQLDFSYGLTNFLTISTGVQISTPYKAFALGTGFNLGDFGALSLDFINAHTDFFDKKINGNSFKINYSKSILPTNTNLSLIGYKHFDSNYYSFNEAMNVDNNYWQYKVKNEFTMNVSQVLPSDMGNFNLSSTLYNYQNGTNSKSINTGYSNSYNGANYGLYYTFTQNNRFNDTDNSDYSVSFSVSMPFFGNKRKSSTSMNYSLSTNKDKNTISNVGLTGMAGERNQASWNIYQGYDDNGTGYFSGINSSYQSRYAKINAGYTYTDDLRSLNLGLSGSIIATQYGVLISQPVYGTNALVVIDKAKDVSIINSTASVTNSSGLTLVTGLQPYTENTISIDPKSIPEDVELESTILNHITPTQGALILANFKAQKGYKLLLTLTDSQGYNIPFGAQAAIDNGGTALVSNFGQLFILSHKPSGNINIHWTKNRIKQTCNVEFDIKKINSINGLYINEKKCVIEINEEAK